ncbi:YecA family protein [Clostridium ihumii]|uniref:YecA family protein n=1 Tax=Clostridium ihumii TaxID=1470356 RepID=UPI003D3561A3
MINSTKLNEARKTMIDEYTVKFSELNSILQKIDKLEFISFISFVNNITSQGGKHGIEPFIIEFLIGVALSNWKIPACCEKGSVEDTLQAWKLAEDLIKCWSGYIYIDNLSETDSDDDIVKKMFVSSMKSTYGLTKGYSWYSKIEERHISEIFEGLDHDMEKLIGFYPADAWKVVSAYERYISKTMINFRNRTKENILDNSSEPSRFYKKLFNYNYKEIMKFKLDDIVDECPDVSVEHIQAFLDFFTINLDNQKEFQYKYITDDNPYLSKPILKENDSYYIPAPYGILWNLRERIEVEIKGNQKFWNRYDKKHKAKFLEDESVRLFQKILPQCKIYKSLYYYPEGDTSGCELDAIALYDNIIILIEAKSGIYTRPAKRGGLLRLENDIQKNIEYAYLQGNRTKKYIIDSEEAIFYENNNKSKEVLRIRGEKYRHIFIINTTLDYFAELGIDLYKLRNLGIYKESEFPWTVCLSDLEVISDFMDFPNQFIYYMMIRSKINNTLSSTNKVKLLYELDLLAMYKLENTEKFNKYDCEAFDEKIIIDLLKDKDDDKPYEIQQCVSKDFSLFFYEFYDEYLKTKQKPKIINKLYNERFLSICRQIEEYNEFGYSDFIFRFLDMELECQNWIISNIDNLCLKSKRDKKMHALTIKQMPTQFFDEKYGMVIYVGYVKERNRIEELARRSGIVQQGLTGIKDWITLCIYLDDDRHLVNQFYYFFGNEKSALIGNSIVQHIPIQKSEKIGRNDHCPCGSKLKYKKCCGQNG